MTLPLSLTWVAPGLRRSSPSRVLTRRHTCARRSSRKGNCQSASCGGPRGRMGSRLVAYTAVMLSCRAAYHIVYEKSACRLRGRRPKTWGSKCKNVRARRDCRALGHRSGEATAPRDLLAVPEGPTSRFDTRSHQPRETGLNFCVELLALTRQIAVRARRRPTFPGFLRPAGHVCGGGWIALN